MLLPQLTELCVLIEALPPAVSRALRHALPASRACKLQYIPAQAGVQEFHEQAWDADAEVEAASASSNILSVHILVAALSAPGLSLPAGPRRPCYPCHNSTAPALAVCHLELAGLGLHP
jgi:hypothetical protein